jgi:small-conductance mechanosensitive channel/CRP-like cAMP-binding protein
VTTDTGFFSVIAGLLLRPDTAALLATVAILGLVMLQTRPADGRTVRNTILLFLAGLGGQIMGSALFAGGLIALAGSLHEVATLVVGFAIIRLAGMTLFRVVLPASRVDAPRIVEDIVLILAYVGWGMVRLRYAGLDLSGIIATSAVITAVLAFSMQDTLGNILGGIALQLDDSVGVGDWIKVDEVTGRVVDIRWRFTAVETRNWETVVIPNSVLMKGKFLVLGRRQGQPAQWRRWVWFNVELRVPPARVIRIVEAALRDATVPNVSARPAPNCVIMDFEHGYGRYALRYWLTDLAVDDPTDSAVRTHIYAALQRAGIQIAIAEHRLNVTKETEKRAQVVRSRDVSRRQDMLQDVDLFRELTEEERIKLAERLVYTPFAAGSQMTRQGSVAHWLYIITAGEAEVHIESPNGAMRLVNTLHAGDIMGEMGLITGAPRSATVTAKTDVESYRLDKPAFTEILQTRPALAEVISGILAARKVALESALRDADDARVERAVADQSTEILKRIRRFFGLGA